MSEEEEGEKTNREMTHDLRNYVAAAVVVVGAAVVYAPNELDAVGDVVFVSGTS